MPRVVEYRAGISERSPPAVDCSGAIRAIDHDSVEVAEQSFVHAVIKEIVLRQGVVKHWYIGQIAGYDAFPMFHRGTHRLCDERSRFCVDPDDLDVEGLTMG